MSAPSEPHSPPQRPDEENDAPRGEVVLYVSEDGRTRVECRFQDETLWLSQALMAELFQTTPQNITLHLKTLYEEGEIDEAATCKEYLQVRREGARQVRRSVKHYNLDAILAIGYRVRSLRGMQFRQWATERLREYLVKGFTMDDERLRNPPVEGSGVPDYFDELLERIRDIRASERRMYLRVLDIFALAADYQPSREDVRLFFQTIQNKLHYSAPTWPPWKPRHAAFPAAAGTRSDEAFSQSREHSQGEHRGDAPLHRCVTGKRRRGAPPELPALHPQRLASNPPRRLRA